MRRGEVLGGGLDGHVHLVSEPRPEEQACGLVVSELCFFTFAVVFHPTPWGLWGGCDLVERHLTLGMP